MVLSILCATGPHFQEQIPGAHPTAHPVDCPPSAPTEAMSSMWTGTTWLQVLTDKAPVLSSQLGPQILCWKREERRESGCGRGRKEREEKKRKV